MKRRSFLGIIGGLFAAPVWASMPQLKVQRLMHCYVSQLDGTMKRVEFQAPAGLVFCAPDRQHPEGRWLHADVGYRDAPRGWNEDCERSKHIETSRMIARDLGI